MVMEHQPFFLTRMKCPSCRTPLHKGITVIYDKATNSDVCRMCNAVLRRRH